MIAHFIFLFAGVTVVWLFYWTIIRTFILDSAIDELRRMRSELDWAILEDRVGAKTEAAQELAKQLQHCDSIRWHSISPALIYRLFRKTEVRVQLTRERELFNNCQSWIREMWLRENQVCTKAAFANSPALWIPFAIILLAAVFSRQIQQWCEETETAAGKLKCEHMVCAGA